MNYQSVTSETKPAGNVGNWATSNTLVRSGKSENSTRRRKDEKPYVHSFEVDDGCDDDTCSLVAFLEVNNVNQVADGDVIWVTH